MIRSYHRNNMGRIFKIENADNTYKTLDYNSIGQVVKNIDEDGFKTELKYNEAELLTLMKCSEGNYVNYEYDGNRFLKAVSGSFGTMSFERDRNGSVKDYSYSYDEVGRIAKVVLNGKILREYSYDIFGNRTDKVEYSKDEVITTKYIYKGGKLVEERIAKNNSLIQKRYEYDKRGNLIKKFSDGELETEYKYNGLGQLISVISGKNIVTYEYDGLGHRIGKTESNGNESHTTSYVIDIRKKIDNILWQNSDGNERSFVWDIQLISEVEDDNSTNIICDELGSIILEGNEIFEYSEFGEVLGSKPKNFGFAGLMVDDISGNYLSATRMYDENLGRFLGKDKIKGDIRYGFTQNEYTYCYNAPLIFVDSTGESPEVNVLDSVLDTVGDIIKRILFYGICTVNAGRILESMLVLKLMPKQVVDVVVNAGNMVWSICVPNGIKEGISSVLHGVFKGLRNISEVTGISDFMNEITEDGGIDILLKGFDFYRDDKGLIHTISNCWQRLWGYNKWYDFAFDAVTSMNRARFQFGTGKSAFTLWMWKGDYFNFGAGSEIGIYKGDNFHVDCYTQSHLKMYMNLTLKDGTVVSDWDAYDQWMWWITSFNAAKEFQDIKSEDLVMIGMIDFGDEREMWKEFVHTAEFNDPNIDKINDNWCLDFVHRNAVMKWEGGNKN